MRDGRKPVRELAIWWLKPRTCCHFHISRTKLWEQKVSQNTGTRDFGLCTYVVWIVASDRCFAIAK